MTGVLTQYYWVSVYQNFYIGKCVGRFKFQLFCVSNWNLESIHSRHLLFSYSCKKYICFSYQFLADTSSNKKINFNLNIIPWSICSIRLWHNTRKYLLLSRKKSICIRHFIDFYSSYIIKQGNWTVLIQSTTKHAFTNKWFELFKCYLG